MNSYTEIRDTINVGYYKCQGVKDISIAQKADN